MMRQCAWQAGWYTQQRKAATHAPLCVVGTCSPDVQLHAPPCRLWKYTPEFMRVARHAPEVAEAARVARHSPEIVRALSHMPEAARVLQHSPEVARVFRWERGLAQRGQVNLSGD